MTDDKSLAVIGINPKIDSYDLTFGFGNSKLSPSTATFSLPAGHTCPFAKQCMAKSDRLTGKLSAGPHSVFRCFSASQENAYPNVRASRWTNFDKLRACNGSVEKMAQLIQRSIKPGTMLVRIHVSGDFFSERYFLAWLNVAMNNPLTIFYGYTKALPFWVKYRKHLPSNFRLVASRGGTHDALIGKYHLKSAEVVFSPEEAAAKGLEIDHDDSHAVDPTKKSFALLLHGTQPPGSAASKAWVALRNRGIGGYGESVISRNMQPVKSKEVKIYIDLVHGEITLPQEKAEWQFTPKYSVNLPDFALVENGEFGL